MADFSTYDARGASSVVPFPVTPEIAARRYWAELERVDRLEYEGKKARPNPRVLAEYHRLVTFADAPWRR
jgi:hypothetical protein